MDTEHNYVTNNWSRTISQPLLIGLMTTALFAAIVSIINNLSPNDFWYWLVPLIFFVTLEAIYTTIWLSQPQHRILDPTAYRLSELFVLLLLTRLYTWAVSGGWPQAALLGDYLKYPWRLLLDLHFFVGALLVILAWFRARAVSSTFNDLRLDEAEVTYYTQEVHQREMGNKPVMINRAEQAAALFQHWIWGGIVVAVCLALAVIDMPAGLSFRPPFGFSRLQLPAALLLAAIIYFVAGMMLVSQARMAALNARWLHEGMRKSDRVEPIWLRFGLVMLLVLAVVAAFLPLGSTFAIGRILELLILAVAAVATFVSYFFIIVTSLIFSLFAGQGAGETAVTPEALPTLPPTPTAVPAATVSPAAQETTTILLSSMFWSVAVVVGIMALSFYLRGRGIRPSWAMLRGMWAGFQAWLRDVWRGVAAQAAEVRLAVQQRRQRDKENSAASEDKRPFRFIRINGLTPRQQIRYFYLSTVKRAADRGVERKADETPLEYVANLQENWPEAAEELDTLTDAFLHARYGHEELEKEDAQQVKKRWKTVKRQLKKK